MTKNVSESSFNASRSRYSTIPRGSCPPRDLKSHRIRVAALQTVALTHPAHVDASRIKVAVGSKKIQEVFTGEQKSVFRHNRLPKCQFRQRTPLTTRTSIYNKNYPIACWTGKVRAHSLSVNGQQSRVLPTCRPFT